MRMRGIRNGKRAALVLAIALAAILGVVPSALAEEVVSMTGDVPLIELPDSNGSVDGLNKTGEIDLGDNECGNESIVVKEPETDGQELALLVQTSGTDDYPSNLKNAYKDAVVDPWNFYNRECTSFVAWRLNNDNGVAFHNWYGGVQWGHAKDWGAAARSIGIAVDSNPAEGSVAWWNTGGYGHVAWVRYVNGNDVTIEDYNSDYLGNYGSRIINKSTVSGFIHVKDLNPNQDPYGFFDECWDGDGTTRTQAVRVRGWVYDADSYDTPVRLHVYVGGPAGSGASCYTTDVAGNKLVANMDRPDLGKACGYDYTIPVEEVGDQPIYVYALNNEGGNNPLLTGGPRTVHINQDPYGFFDECWDGDGTTRTQAVRVRGWVYDADSYDTPVRLHVYVGGPAGSGARCYTTDVAGNKLVANMDRPDLGKACGYDYTIPVEEVGDQPIYVYALNNEGGNNPLLVGGPRTIKISQVTKYMSLEDARITGLSSKTFTGAPIMQKPCVTLNGNKLAANKDYTVSYQDNTYVGTATVIVTGTGSYTGSKSVTFKINAASLSGATVSGLSAKTYNGKAQIQSLTVNVGAKKLKLFTDYMVSYKDNVNAGTATVTVAGNGNYAGTKIATFKIGKAKQPMVVKVSKKTAKLTTVKKKAVSLTKCVTMKKNQGKVSYGNASTQKAVKKFKVNSRTGTIIIPKGTKKGTYLVKVKVTAKGNSNYTAGSKTVTVKVTVK